MKAFILDVMLIIVSIIVSILACIFTFNFPLTEAFHEWIVDEIHRGFCYDYGNHRGNHDIGMYYLLTNFLFMAWLTFRALSERYKKQENSPQTTV
ncbi:hypothetical protein DC898_22140 [Vibrio parahaemolyticus]|nr:hypothetical protein [Vibrio parahaemolyticus]